MAAVAKFCKGYMEASGLNLTDEATKYSARQAAFAEAVRVIAIQVYNIPEAELAAAGTLNEKIETIMRSGQGTTERASAGYDALSGMADVLKLTQ